MPSLVYVHVHVHVYVPYVVYQLHTLTIMTHTDLTSWGRPSLCMTVESTPAGDTRELATPASEKKWHWHTM